MPLTKGTEPPPRSAPKEGAHCPGPTRKEPHPAMSSETSSLLGAGPGGTGAAASTAAPSSSSGSALKKLYKSSTRAGIGGKLKDADPLVVWFLGLAFTLPALILVLLPLFECTLFVCNEEDGSISISSVIEYLPLATVYAVMGAVTITILCYYQLIICKRGWKIVFAISGYLCLLVPLMLPLSVESEVIYHDVFAAIGFLSEVIFVLLVFLDITLCAPVPPNGTYVVYTCAFASAFAIVLFLTGWLVGTDDPDFDLVYQIISEYLIGLSALALVKVLEYFEIYPMPQQFDECCYPWLPPQKELLPTASLREDRPGVGAAFAGGEDSFAPDQDKKRRSPEVRDTSQ